MRVHSQCSQTAYRPSCSSLLHGGFSCSYWQQHVPRPLCVAVSGCSARRCSYGPHGLSALCCEFPLLCERNNHPLSDISSCYCPYAQRESTVYVVNAWGRTVVDVDIVGETRPPRRRWATAEVVSRGLLSCLITGLTNPRVYDWDKVFHYPSPAPPAGTAEEPYYAAACHEGCADAIARGLAMGWK